VGQIQIAHEVGDRDSLSASTAKMSRRGSHDPFSRFLFVLRRVPHFESDIDDIHHLYRACQRQLRQSAFASYEPAINDETVGRKYWQQVWAVD